MKYLKHRNVRLSYREPVRHDGSVFAIRLITTIRDIVYMYTKRSEVESDFGFFFISSNMTNWVFSIDSVWFVGFRIPNESMISIPLAIAFETVSVVQTIRVTPTRNIRPNSNRRSVATREDKKIKKLID
jgi:hypothetical protein